MTDPKPRYRLFILDLDGTLVDTAPDIADTANRVLAHYGFKPRDMRSVKRAIGMGVHDLLIQMTGPGVMDTDILESAVQMFRELYADNCAIKSRAFNGVQSVLAGPLAKHTKVVITNKPQALSEKILLELKLNDYFEMVIGAGTEFPLKPDPASIKHVLQRFKCPRHEAVFIGDSSIDREACRRAGVDFVWMTYGYEDLSKQNGFRTFDDASRWAELA